jgi:DNA-binding SARP family transcriptional activator
LEFRVLGPLEIRRGSGELVVPTRRKERELLAILLLNPNRPVSVDALIEGLWGSRPPASAVANLQSYLSDLRRILRRDHLQTRHGGYLLQVDGEELDTTGFERLAGDGQRALDGQEYAVAAERLARALGLWRGRVLEGLSVPDAVEPEVTRLEELRVAVLEDSVEARLATGQHVSLSTELPPLVARHELRERLWGQLMLALYRSGRQSDALDTYRRLRRLLDEELGVGPSPPLQRLHQRILAADPDLDLAAPALVTANAPPPPRQLPAAPGHFVARAEALKRLDAQLTEAGAGAAPLCAVVGTAGVGKTALVVHWAYQVASRFPDGQLYVNLRGYSAEPRMRPVEALARFLRALDVPAEQIPADLDEAAAMYRSLLAAKRVLVVLDNADNPDQVRPLLPGGPASLAVVTSREQMLGLVARDGAYRLRLDTFAPHEALDLLGRVLGPQRVAAEPDAAAELAEACDFLPLALRIAAANLTGDPSQSIADQVRALTSGDRLTALAVAGDEQTAVRAAFDLSYRVLTAGERRLFRRLGLVPGADFAIGVAAALDPAGARSATVLARLAGANLVEQHAGDRFAFHDLLRRYAAERAAAEESPADRAAARQRLFDWYLRAADAAARLLYPQLLRLPLPPAAAPEVPFAGAAGALTWLDAERFNLLDAVRQAAATGPRPAAWQLADTLRGYFALRRHTVDWLAAAHAADSAAAQEDEVCGQAAAQLSLAHAERCRGRYRQAIRHLESALALNRRAGWTAAEGTCQTNLGNVHIDLGLLDRAAEHLAEAVRIARETGEPAREALALTSLGIVRAGLGRLRDAEACYRQALARQRKIGFRAGAAITLTNLGNADRMLGRFDGALAHLTEALAIHREVGDRDSEAVTLDRLAATHRDAGQYARAVEYARAALALARDIGDRRTEAEALSTLAETQLRQGDRAAARDGFQRAGQLARQGGWRRCAVAAQIGLALAELRLPPVEEALAAAREAGYRVLEGRALTALADIHLAGSRSGDARAAAQRALEIQLATGHRLGTARALIVLGNARSAAGEPEPARSCWARARDILTELGSEDAAFG